MLGKGDSISPYFWLTKQKPNNAALHDIGDMPEEMLEPVLDKASASQLKIIETSAAVVRPCSPTA